MSDDAILEKHTASLDEAHQRFSAILESEYKSTQQSPDRDRFLWLFNKTHWLFDPCELLALIHMYKFILMLLSHEYE